MKLRVYITIVFLCALILGCVQENKNVTINNITTTPTESKGENLQVTGKITISKLTTVTPTPKINSKNTIANTSKTIGQSTILQYNLKTPPDVEYE